MKYNRARVDLEREQRRKRVAELLRRGDMNHTEIANFLNYDLSTISKDVKWLKSQAQAYVFALAKSDLAYFYVSTIQDLDTARASAWRIHDNCSDAQPRDKLAALKVIAMCDVERFKLLSEGPNVMMAKSLDEKVRQIQADIIANRNGTMTSAVAAGNGHNNKRIVV